MVRKTPFTTSIEPQLDVWFAGHKGKPSKSIVCPSCGGEVHWHWRKPMSHIAADCMDCDAIWDLKACYGWARAAYPPEEWALDSHGRAKPFPQQVASWLRVRPQGDFPGWALFACPKCQEPGWVALDPNDSVIHFHCLAGHQYRTRRQQESPTLHVDNNVEERIPRKERRSSSA